MPNVIGPDVSYYQNSPTTPTGIDFNKMRQAADFVIIRAGQGSWTDPDFLKNWIAAKAAGLPRGSYWFYDSRTSPIAQANQFAGLLQSDPPECGAWLDLEEEYHGPYQGWSNWILCLDYLRMTLPRVGIYTGPGYWAAHREGLVQTGTTKDGKPIFLPKMTADALTYFKRFELWIAHYGVSVPLVPTPWTNWVFWQFTSSGDGTLYGVESKEIDLNQFNGSEQTFRNYFDLPILPEPPTGETMRIIKGTVVAEGLNIRSTPAGAAFNPARYLHKFDKIEASENSAQWLHLSSINGVPVTDTEWASAGASQQYIQWSWVDVPPVEPPAGPALTHTIKVYNDGSIDVDGVPAS